MNEYLIVGSQQLKTFAKADTSSEVTGLAVASSHHEVLEYSKSHDVDYAKVAIGWICIRWKDQKYARVAQLGRPGEITWGALLAEAGLLTGWAYSFSAPRWPRALPGLPSRFVQGARQTNCCAATEAVIVGAAGGYGWDSQRHEDAMIFDVNRPFSPADAFSVYAKPGTSIEMNPTDVCDICFVQGADEKNRSPGVQYDKGDRGHSFMILSKHGGTGRLLTLEANAAYEIDGFGHRGVGAYNGKGIPNRWWEDDDCWTWERFLEYYDGGLAVVQLNIVDGP